MERKCENKCTTFFNKKAKLLYYEPIIETYVCEKADVITLSGREVGGPDKSDFGDMGF